MAWLKLLRACGERDRHDLYIRDPGGRRQWAKDGDWLLKPLHALVSELMEEKDPRRANVLFFPGLLNRIEHHYDLAAVVAGRLQAWMLNLEEMLTQTFGPKEALRGELRFPLFLSSITDDVV